MEGLRSRYINIEKCVKCAWFNHNDSVKSTSCCPDCGADISYVTGRYVYVVKGFLFFKHAVIVGFEPKKEAKK